MHGNRHDVIAAVKIEPGLVIYQWRDTSVLPVSREEVMRVRHVIYARHMLKSSHAQRSRPRPSAVPRPPVRPAPLLIVRAR